MQENGLALEYAASELRKDREIVLAAVQQNGAALAYAAPELKNEIERSNLIAFTAPSNKKREFKTGKSNSSSPPGTKKNLLNL